MEMGQGILSNDFKANILSAYLKDTVGLLLNISHHTLLIKQKALEGYPKNNLENNLQKHNWTN